jgi:hypothetical protein
MDGYNDSDDKVYFNTWIYYRVSDLVLAYVHSKKFDYDGPTDILLEESWTEYLNGGRAEY